MVVCLDGPEALSRVGFRSAFVETLFPCLNNVNRTCDLNLYIIVMFYIVVQHCNVIYVIYMVVKHCDVIYGRAAL